MKCLELRFGLGSQEGYCVPSHAQLAGSELLTCASQTKLDSRWQPYQNEESLVDKSFLTLIWIQ